jgi:hypothetical protein
MIRMKKECEYITRKINEIHLKRRNLNLLEESLHKRLSNLEK